MTKIIVSLILVLVSSFAQAGIYYDSKESCMSTGYAGKAVDYKPTAKHKAYGENRIAKYELRRLESDACVLIGAVPGKRWAFLKEGNSVLTKGTVVKMLAECQNDIYEIHYLKKGEPIVSTGTTQFETAPASCATDGCGNVTKTQIITHVVKEVKVCESANGKRFESVGECQFEPVKAKVSVQVESKAECCNANVVKPAVPASVSKVDCTDCTPALTVTGKVDRTDGRCVLKVSDGGEIRFIRFGLQDGGHVSAVRVTDEKGDNLMRQYASMVGYDDDGGKATAKLPNKDCRLAIKAFSEPRALKWTAPRLGLSTCTIVGQV